MASPFGSIYNPENVFVSTEGGGAGNNWALGYAQGCTVQDGIMDMLDREADSSDSLEVPPSPKDALAGISALSFDCWWDRLGTWIAADGAATGSLWEQADHNLLGLSELGRGQRRRRAAVQFAPCDEANERAHRLHGTTTRLTFAQVILDNSAINRIAADRMHISNPTFLHTNQLISTAMAAMTAPLRFPGFMDTDMTGLLSALVPLPQCHYLMAGYTPFTANGPEKVRTV